MLKDLPSMADIANVAVFLSPEPRAQSRRSRHGLQDHGCNGGCHVRHDGGPLAEEMVRVRCPQHNPTN